MSDLQRSFAKAQLAKLPADLAPVWDEGDEGYEEEEEEDNFDTLGPASVSSNDSSSSASSTGTIIPSPSRKLFERPGAAASRSRSDPLPWQDFFSQELYIEQRTGSSLISHHIYLTPQYGSGPLFVTHHGAGSSGLSFGTFSKEIQTLVPGAGVLSLDARGHGQTTEDQRGELNLTLSTLAKDLSFIVEATRQRLEWPQLPDLILIGHSLGGAVVTEVASQRLLGTALLGYGVLDVVEGSAMDALQSMDQYLSTRPRSFPSISSGIDWHTRSRTIRNTTSARVSVPSLLEEQSDGKWTWRTDLGATKPFWENWFIGLSKKFLESRGGKLLILAGTDRLDKDLMIGQMQGKYQLQVFPEAGHFVQEDQPAKTAQVVAEFYRRNDRSTLVLPPKVDDLIRQGKLKSAASR